MVACQFLHLGAYGRVPRKGDPEWAAISGITSEGARAPAACNHLAYRGGLNVLVGSSPVEAGRLAIERAEQAYDHDARRRRLRKDGKALLAGVASFPKPRKAVESDPIETKKYEQWKELSLQWLVGQFGSHLASVVEHNDEQYLHLHFYVVPALSSDGRLNIRELHPGLSLKTAAAEAGASKVDQEAAYRWAMSLWQDHYWHCVSRHCGHMRYGQRRARVSRQQRLMEKRLEEDTARRRTAERAEIERELAQRRAEWERELAVMTDHIRDHECAHLRLRKACISYEADIRSERSARQHAEHEAARLRAELAALRGDLSGPRLR